MALRDYVVPTEEVDIPGSMITVRGLSLPDLTVLARKHGSELQTVFKSLTGKDAPEQFDSVTIGKALLDLPEDLIGLIIALAADEPDLASVAGKLPLTSQAEALEKIVILTFKQEGGLPKFMETLIRIFEGITSASETLQTPSKGGSELSEGT